MVEVVLTCGSIGVRPNECRRARDEVVREVAPEGVMAQPEVLVSARTARRISLPSSSTMMHRPVTHGASGCRPAAATTASNAPGRYQSSALSHPMRSPDAIAIPLFTASDSPLSGSEIHLTFVRPVRMSIVPSVDPPSMTICSTAGNPCSATLSSALARVEAELRQGVTIEIVGVVPSDISSGLYDRSQSGAEQRRLLEFDNAVDGERSPTSGYGGEALAIGLDVVHGRRGCRQCITEWFRDDSRSWRRASHVLERSPLDRCRANPMG